LRKPFVRSILHIIHLTISSLTSIALIIYFKLASCEFARQGRVFRAISFDDLDAKAPDRTPQQ
jgi:hypothetical protein